MSGPSTNPENDLSSTLARQAEQFARRGGADLDLGQVVSRAGEIRRGRRMRATMAMAAVVLAVAVPVGVTVLNDATTPHKPDPAAPADTSPISLANLDVGAEPRNGYALGTQLHDGAGTAISLAAAVDETERSANEIVRINGGFLVKRVTEKYKLEVTFLADRGAPAQSWSSTFGFAVSPEQNVGAFVQPDGTVIAVQGGGETAVTVGRVVKPYVPGQSQSLNGFRAVAMTGEDCSEGGSCAVYVQQNQTGDGLWVVRPGQEPTKVHPGILSLADVSADGTVAGPVSATDDGSCSELRSVEDGVLWKTCDLGFRTFSPDGSHLLARGPYASGMGDGQMLILDVQAQEPVLDLRTEGEAIVYSAIWEDDEHVLAIVFEKGRWAVVRFGLDGAREYALAPVADPNGDFVVPFTLVER